MTNKKNLAEYPTYYGQKGRALVWLWRARAAFNLARYIDGEEVTVEEVEKARDLLKRLTNYALASAHQWERANNSERYANSDECTTDEQRLDRRRARLVAELCRYGLGLWNYGLYPTIVEMDEESKRTHLFREAKGVSLHYFN